MLDLDLDHRTRIVLGHVIDAYCQTGEPVGSKYLAEHYGLSLSSATIRNVMGELERQGLLYAPHTSAGRMPTEDGLRFFVRFMMEVQDLPPHERSDLEASVNLRGLDWDAALDQISTTLSGLSQCAGIVSAPKIEDSLKQIYFVRLGSDRALVVLISEGGAVENRIAPLDPRVTDGMLEQAQNYLTAKLKGLTLAQGRGVISKDLSEVRASLDAITADLIEQGLEVWSSSMGAQTLVVRGTANLFTDRNSDHNLDLMKEILQSLETKDFAAKLLDAVIDAQGLQIFIGSENPLFHNSGCSVVLSPYINAQGKVIGAVGVVGPNSMNYSRVVPVINYAAKLLNHHLKF